MERYISTTPCRRQTTTSLLSPNRGRLLTMLIPILLLSSFLTSNHVATAFQLPSLSFTTRRTTNYHRIHHGVGTPYSPAHTQHSARFTSCLYMSDVPQDKDRPGGRGREAPNQLYNQNQVSLTAFLHQWVRNLTPPPMEDQWTLLGDLGSLVLYSITSHSINDMMVNGILSSSNTLQKAVETLDPNGDVLKTSNSMHMLQAPVWLNEPHPDLMNSITTSIIHDKMMEHWGPLFTTTGMSAVILCSFWLLAGWVTRAFLFENTLECSTGKALRTTVTTWLATVFLIAMTAWTVNHMIVPTWIEFQEMYVPFSSHYHSHSSAVYAMGEIPDLFTKSDSIFVIDSVSVLLAWRFMSSMFWGYSDGRDDK